MLSLDEHMLTYSRLRLVLHYFVFLCRHQSFYKGSNVRITKREARQLFLEYLERIDINAVSFVWDYLVAWNSILSLYIRIVADMLGIHVLVPPSISVVGFLKYSGGDLV